MPEMGDDNISNMKLLIGLKLFSTENTDLEKKEAYQRFVKKIKKSNNDFGIIRKWAHKFLPYSLWELSNKITRLIRLSSFLLLVLSFLTGITAAGFLFYYDGSAPINVLSVLTAFILIPIILLISSFLLPLISGKHEGLLAPLYHWIESRVQRYLSNDRESTTQSFSNEMIEFELVYSEPVLLFFKKTLQKCAIFYAMGALLWMLANVITTDLAFSWSSTLELEADNIYTITTTMSAPWSWLLPSATVDYDTVQSTRYFRAGQTDLSEVSSGGWWSFIFMSILCYSFLPRLFIYAYYESRLKRILMLSVKDSDQGHFILKFAEEKLVVESSGKKNSVIYPDSDEQKKVNPKTESATLLLWHLPDVDNDRLKNILSRNILSVHNISGISPTKDDKIIAQKISSESARHNNCDVVVFAKFWESPNIRFEKVLNEILRHNPKSLIKIIPLYEHKDQINDLNKMNWAKRIQSLNLKTGSKRIFLEDSASTDIDRLI